VSCTDNHYDAKLWPHMHPYGTGSLSSELGSGGLARLGRNRLLLLQSCFRNNTIYAFWFLHRIITKDRSCMKPPPYLNEVVYQCSI
jgi:hypothetical protein